MMSKLTLIFDVNETLLDLTALDPIFARHFGDAGVRRLWFAQMIQNALVATITDVYSPFGELGMAALSMVAARLGKTLTDEQRAEVRAGMTQLPAHPDVRPALERLRGAGFRLATLTNSTQAVAEAQLRYAGLADWFERILSADAVRRLKPAPAPYHMAAYDMGVEIGRTCLIAAHAWDVAGARRAGMQTIFVARPGMVIDPLVPAPLMVGQGLADVADWLLQASP
jgi:2-haloacid dehalogenase